MSSLTALNDQARRATLGWYADPGHAWLAVSLDEEHGLPIATQFASNFSFIDATGDNFAGIVYLEEDEDAVAFIKAYGIDARTLPIWSVDEESEIRNLPRGTKPAEGYCEHGTYVGGVMEDFMCGYCEA